MARAAHLNATYPQKIAALILIAFESGHPFVCAICGKPILPGQVIQFDHGAAVGRGGTNEVKDIRPVHTDAAPFDCHQRKTWGGSAKATTLGTDTHEAAKLKRQTGERWCVRSREGWCASKPNKAHKEEVDSVETVCRHFVTLPGGCDFRKPDCPDCIAVLNPQSRMKSRGFSKEHHRKMNPPRFDNTKYINEDRQ